MLDHTCRPKVAISKCINYDDCTYSGNGYKNSFIKRMENHVDFIAFCPEVEIGLPIPRNSLRLVGKTDDDIRIIQPKTESDYTKTMYEYADTLSVEFKDVDGFILKSRSPSCGTKDVKVYDTSERGSNSRKGRGIIGGKLLDAFSSLAIEEDGRLNDYKIREHFLTKLYTITEFNQLKRNASIDNLRDFHMQHALLFSAYNKKASKLLDKLVETAKDDIFNSTLNDYEKILERIFKTSPRYTSNVKVLQSVVDEIAANLSNEELTYANELIEQYTQHQIPFSVPLHVIKAHLIRFNRSDLLSQRFFEPFPKELLEVADSGKSL